MLICYSKHVRGNYNIVLKLFSRMTQCVIWTKTRHCGHATVPEIDTVEFQWLVHLWDRGNVFETWIVRGTVG